MDQGGQRDLVAHPSHPATLLLCITQQHSRKSQCQRHPPSVTDFLPLPTHLGYQPPAPHPHPGPTGAGGCNPSPQGFYPRNELQPLPQPPTVAPLPGWGCGLLVAIAKLPSATWLADCLLPALSLKVTGQRPKVKKPLFQMERSCPPKLAERKQTSSSAGLPSNWQWQGLPSWCAVR